MKQPRVARARERGQAAVVVAIAAVVLLVVTGLVIDGGMEAGAYRHAQNAADAGALAAARREYINAVSTPQQTSSASTLSPYAQKEVEHNGAQMTWVSSSSNGGLTTVTAMKGGDAGRALAAAAPHAQTMEAGGIGYSFAFAAASPTIGTGGQVAWVPSSTGSNGASSALVDTWATAGTVLVPTDAHMQLMGVQSTSKSQSPNPTGSQASSLVSVAEADQAATGTGYLDCYTATATYVAGTNQWGTPTACAAGTFPTGVTGSGSLAAVPVPDAEVNVDNEPSAIPVVAGLNLSLSDPTGSVTETATSAMSRNALYWDLVNGITATSEVRAAGLSVSTAAVGVSATVMRISLHIYLDSSGNPQISTVCDPTTLTLTNTVTHQSGTVPIDSGCHAGNLPSLGLASVSVPWFSPSTAPSTACTVNSSSGEVSCDVQGCLVRATVTASPFNTVLCVGQVHDTFDAVPIVIAGTLCASPPCVGTTSSSSSSSTTSSTTSTTSSSTSSSTTNSSSSSSDEGGGGTPPVITDQRFPQFTGPVTVAATIPQPTFFMRVLGWDQTSPAAQATADIERVVDESTSAFQASPYGIPDNAQMMDAPFSTGQLQVGHEYYLWGANMQSYDYSSYMPATWQGRLDTSSNHRVGQQLSGSTAVATGPSLYLGTNPYYLEPVFDPVTGVVLWYGVFTQVAGQPNWGKLVNSVPASGGYIVQATSVPGWSTLDRGAVSIKLES